MKTMIAALAALFFVVTSFPAAAATQSSKTAGLSEWDQCMKVPGNNARTCNYKKR